MDLLTPVEERLTSPEGLAVERWVLVERDTLPDVVERRFCVLVEGWEAVLPEREVLPVERLTLPEEREALPVERDTLPEPEEDLRFWVLTEGRDALAEERDALDVERETLPEERDALEDGRETLAEERDAPAEERETLAEDRLAPPPPRDWANVVSDDIAKAATIAAIHAILKILFISAVLCLVNGVYQ